MYFGSNAPFLYFANNTYFLNNENETIEYSIERSKKVKSVEEFRKRVYITKSVTTSKLNQLFDNSKNTIRF